MASCGRLREGAWHRVSERCLLYRIFFEVNAEFAFNHLCREALQELLAKAVEYCPRAEVLWLMAAKEKWLSGDIGGAKDILTKAFEQNPDSESIWLAAAKLAAETGQMEAAMQVLEKARKEADTDRVSAQ
jgi:pre-mRNA-processing factor 6